MFLGCLKAKFSRGQIFLSSMVAEPTDQPDMLDQESGTPLEPTKKISTNLLLQQML